MTCWLASIGAPGDCDGPIDPAHLIPKQRIRKELHRDLTPEQLHELIWHPSVWRPICRRHHGDLDNRVYRLDRFDVPSSVQAFADIWGLNWSLDHDYGERIDF